MGNPFSDQLVLNSPYEYTARHWEFDESGQLTLQIIKKRREARTITPIPMPRMHRGAADQAALLLGEKGLSIDGQQYALTSLIYGARQQVDRRREKPDPNPPFTTLFLSGPLPDEETSHQKQVPLWTCLQA